MLCGGTVCLCVSRHVTSKRLVIDRLLAVRVGFAYVSDSDCVPVGRKLGPERDTLDHEEALANQVQAYAFKLYGVPLGIHVRLGYTILCDIASLLLATIIVVR